MLRIKTGLLIACFLTFRIESSKAQTDSARIKCMMAANKTNLDSIRIYSAKIRELVNEIQKKKKWK